MISAPISEATPIMTLSLWDLKQKAIACPKVMKHIMTLSLWDLKPKPAYDQCDIVGNYDTIPMGFETSFKIEEDI